METVAEIVYKNLDDIIPYYNNPRRNEKALDALVESIKEFGFKNPIILDKDSVIIAGHTRRLAALRLGMKEVPCIYANDLTEEQVTAFRLADNRVQSFSKWDEKKLAKEISELVNFDMTDFGFSEKEMEVAEDITRTVEKVNKCPRCGHEWTD